jgi:hypothetical protein
MMLFTAAQLSTMYGLSLLWTSPSPAAPLASSPTLDFLKGSWNLTNSQLYGGLPSDISFVNDKLNNEGVVLEVDYPVGSYTGTNMGGIEFFPQPFPVAGEVQTAMLTYEVIACVLSRRSTLMNDAAARVQSWIPVCQGGQAARSVWRFQRRAVLWREAHTRLFQCQAHVEIQGSRRRSVRGTCRGCSPVADVLPLLSIRVHSDVQWVLQQRSRPVQRRLWNLALEGILLLRPRTVRTSVLPFSYPTLITV